MKKILLFLLCSPLLWAQNSQRHIQDIQLASPFAVVYLNEGYYQFTWLNPHTVQAQYIAGQDSLPTASHAVVAHPQELQLNLMRTGSDIRLFANNNEGIEVRLQSQPFAVSYYYKDQFLTKETEGFTQQEEGFTIDFALQENEEVFGGGARVLGASHRGQELSLYNRAHYGYGTHANLMNFCMPLILSDKRYLIHSDNPSTGSIDVGKSQNDRLRFAHNQGAKRYQIVVADNFKALTENYTQLTGRQPLPPRWALGNFASRFGYHSQRETEQVVAEFKKAAIPLDAVILDLYWFGKEVKGTMGNLEVYRDSFPNFEQMTSDFQKQNIQTIVITEPFITTSSNRWEEAVTRNLLAKNPQGEPYTFDFFFGNTGLIDLFHPDTNRWFWDIYQNLIDLGVTGFWGDLGEPEVHPNDMIHHTGNAAAVHNIYGHHWAKLIHDGYLHNRKERPFILMRSGYSGSQHYGMIPWSGDVARSWEGLQPQPLLALQMGLQGMGYMHSDLGGFAGNTRDAELYTRWLQYGVFNPIFRPHAQEEVPSEPVFWDEKTKNLAKKAIELRYALLPYNYSLAYENTRFGYPLMRPSNWLNSQGLNDGSSYYWGDHFYISPITEKAKKQATIDLPQGTWLDFYTGKAYSGTTQVETQESYIPTFVQAGALIPMSPGIQSTQEYTLAKTQWHLYYHPDMQTQTGTFFYDNGSDAQTIAQNNYHLSRWTTTAAARSLTLEFQGEGIEKITPTAVPQKLILHHLPKKIKLTANGKSLPTVRLKDGTHQVEIPYQNQLKIQIAW